MNLGPAETAQFFSNLEKGAASLPKPRSNFRSCIFPPAIALSEAKRVTSQLKLPLGVELKTGAQNAHWEKKGAYTGELSGPMLQEIGIDWALVGHSERRQFFGETDETARLRSTSLLAQGFTVVLCVGESKEERESGKTQEVLKKQIQATLGKSPESYLSYIPGKLILAYEPVWAIGTGLTATPEQAEEAHSMLRRLVQECLNTQAAQKISILYGGSVTPENISDLLKCSHIDGALVGGASLKPESFLTLLTQGLLATH